MSLDELFRTTPMPVVVEPEPQPSGRHRRPRLWLTDLGSLFHLIMAFAAALASVLAGAGRVHGKRFAWFSGVGLVVFAAGTALQYELIWRGMSADWSYLVQTVFSVELGYALNRSGPFRDRLVSFLPSIARWHAQRVVTITLNILFFDGLTRYFGMGWLEANVISTAVFIPANYFGAYLWVFAERHRISRRFRISIPGSIAALALTAMPVAFIEYRPLIPVVYAAMMLPCLEIVMAGAGIAWYRLFFRRAPQKFVTLIVQVTTRGTEGVCVNEILDTYRSYHLEDYIPRVELWVVTEPGDKTRYHGDKMITVPADFPCQSAAKGRALEYSRTIRAMLGYDGPETKIIFCDDDVTLTKGYILTGFEADYDLSQGIVTPRHGYGQRPLGHFLASHADDNRTHGCLVYCSVFQGILGIPLHVHGEGLVVTGSAESKVTWDVPLISAEDLSFGQRARKAGFTWGWFCEYAEITSPWTLREQIEVQHGRWWWGDMHCLRRRSVMPLGAAVRVGIKYGTGLLALMCTAAGLWLRFSGGIPATAGILNFTKLSLLSWALIAFACGWIGAGAKDSGDSKMLGGLLAVVLIPVSVLIGFASVVVPLAKGDSGSFDMIRKTR